MSAATVGTSAGILDLDTAGVYAIQNLSDGKVYVDFDPDVTDATGYLVPAAGLILPRPLSAAGGALYAVSDTASQDVRILRVG